MVAACQEPWYTRYIKEKQDVLVDAWEAVLPTIYPECDPALFTVYDRCNAYILKQL